MILGDRCALAALVTAAVVGCDASDNDQPAGGAPPTTTTSSGMGGAGGQLMGGSGGTASGGNGGGGQGGEAGSSLHNCDPPVGTLDTIATQVVVDSGLDLPVTLEVAPGDQDRLFVVEKEGRIRVIENGVLLPTPFLDLSAFIWSSSEAGLLGLAFHPDYQRNRRFFVYYVRATANGAHIVEFRRSENDPNVADPIQTHDDPMLELQYGSAHLAGALKFGPHDGYLYLASGDRGDYPDVAQNVNSRLGKILRLDTAVLPYGIPPGNLVGGAPEIFHRGLRNPWRMTFDACTGDMYIGDVGNVSWEEISFVPASAGPQNLGWPILEGETCNPDGPPTCDSTGMTAPLIAHAHLFPDYINCVIGGFVYRGSAIPELRGMYVYGGTGGVFGLRHDNNGNVTEWRSFTADVDITLPVSFGEDHFGELYIVDHLPVGRIMKIVPAP